MALPSTALWEQPRVPSADEPSKSSATPKITSKRIRKCFHVPTKTSLPHKLVHCQVQRQAGYRPTSKKERPEHLFNLLTCDSRHAPPFDIQVFGPIMGETIDIPANDLVIASSREENHFTSAPINRYLRAISSARVSRLAHTLSRMLDTSGRNAQELGMRDEMDPTKLSPDTLHSWPEYLFDLLTCSSRQSPAFDIQVFGPIMDETIDIPAGDFVIALARDREHFTPAPIEIYLKAKGSSRVCRLAHTLSRMLDTMGRNAQEMGMRDEFDPTKLCRTWNTETDGFTFTCLFKNSEGICCGMQFDVIGNALDHVKSVHDDGYVCPEPGCGIRCTTVQAFERHVKYFHVPSKTIPCPTSWCTAKFKDKRAIGPHLRKKRCRTSGRQRPHHTEPRKPTKQKPNTAVVESDSESGS